MTDPFEVLKQLEARVAKAEQRIPELEELLDRSAVNVQDREAKLGEAYAKLEKYERLANEMREVFGLASRDSLNPPVSTGATGSQEISVRDPSRIIEVSDPQEALQVTTLSLRGQIAKLILDGNLAKGLISAKSVRAQLLQEFGKAAEEWDIETITKELKELAAPPYRLFIFTSNRMWRLRANSEKRIKE
jgi:multidrug resistance efflux pump